MIDLGPHAVFIIWAYAGVGVAIAALIAMVWLRARSITARLAALDAKGLRRRASATNGTPAA